MKAIVKNIKNTIDNVCHYFEVISEFDNPQDYFTVSHQYDVVAAQMCQVFGLNQRDVLILFHHRHDFSTMENLLWLYRKDPGVLKKRILTSHHPRTSLTLTLVASYQKAEYKAFIDMGFDRYRAAEMVFDTLLLAQAVALLQNSKTRKVLIETEMQELGKDIYLPANSPSDAPLPWTKDYSLIDTFSEAEFILARREMKKDLVKATRTIGDAWLLGGLYNWMESPMYEDIPFSRYLNYYWMTDVHIYTKDTGEVKPIQAIMDEHHGLLQMCEFLQMDHPSPRAHLKFKTDIDAVSHRYGRGLTQIYEKIKQLSGPDQHRAALNFRAMVILLETLPNIDFSMGSKVNMFDTIARQIDIQYFDMELMNGSPTGLARALIKMGVKPESLYRILTRKEVYKYLDFLDDPLNRMKVLPTSDPLSSIVIWLGYTTYPDKHQWVEMWYTDTERILRYTKNPSMIRWALHHVEQLSRRIQHNAGGRLFTSDSFHILEDLREFDLDQGNKTSFYKLKQLAITRHYSRDLPSTNTNLPVFPDKGAISHPKIRQLTTSDELLRESIEMQHCVATYYEKCMERTSYIFHVDDDSPKGTTIEVRNIDRKWVVYQIQSLFNDDLSKAEAMMKTELDLLNIYNACHQ